MPAARIVPHSVVATQPALPPRPWSTIGRVKAAAPRSDSSKAVPDQWRQVRLGLLVLGVVLVAGTIAYLALGLGAVDAFYQTLITVSTVGFSEVGDNTGTAYRLVTSLLIVLGVGVALYTIGSAFEALMEGRLSEQIARSRRQHVLDQLHGHVVVCGWGQVGVAISAALRAAAMNVVVIDRREDLEDLVDGPFVVGDATEDAVLVSAGIGRARGLVIALDSDADCMYVTLTARLMNPDLFIVARANAAEAVQKLLQAGADRAVSPHEIGGNRMAAFMMQPNVADFLGETMHDGRLQVQLHEFEVSPNSKLDGTMLADSGIQEATGVVLLAVRQNNGSFLHLPRADTKLQVGDVPIVLGTTEQLEALRVFLDHP